MESKAILIIVDTKDEKNMVEFFLKSRRFAHEYKIMLMSEFTTSLAASLDKKVVMYDRRVSRGRE